MQYLDAGNYCGVDPLDWQMEETSNNPKSKAVIEGKSPRFHNNDTFHGKAFDEKFDFIIAHSVMSHAAYWQMEQFLKNSAEVLNEGGKVLFSLYFNDGNPLGSIVYPKEKIISQIKENYRNGKYYGTEYDFREWIYPRNSFFRKESVIGLAKVYGLSGDESHISTMIMSDTNPHYKHSWVFLQK